MLGYVRPCRDELKCRDFDLYQSAYCGLCRTLGKRYGFVARMSLNFDFTFLVMLLMGDGQPWQREHHRCPACPTRKKCMVLSHAGMDWAASATVILTYWKLADDIADHSWLRGLPYRLLALLFRRPYRKAVRDDPDYDNMVRQALQELHQLEAAHSPSIDRTADTFARILQAAAPDGEQTERGRALRQLLYHVGRWIYLIDAENDLEEDRRTGSYNPLCYRFSPEEDHRPYLRTNLQHSLNLAISAFGLLEPSPFTQIIGNILYLGLPAVEEAVFSGQWPALKKQWSRRTNQ